MKKRRRYPKRRRLLKKRRRMKRRKKRIQKKLMPTPFKQFHHFLKLHQSPLPLVKPNLPRIGRLGSGSDFNSYAVG